MENTVSGSQAYFSRSRTDDDGEVRFSYMSEDTSNSGYVLKARARYEVSAGKLLELVV